MVPQATSSGVRKESPPKTVTAMKHAIMEPSLVKLKGLGGSLTRLKGILNGPLSKPECLLLLERRLRDLARVILSVPAESDISTLFKRDQIRVRSELLVPSSKRRLR